MQIQDIQGISPQSYELLATLTDNQKTQLLEIISEYDLENISREEMKKLQEELREANIPRCRETMQILNEAGLEKPKGNPCITYICYM